MAISRPPSLCVPVLLAALLLAAACGPSVTPFVEDPTVYELRHASSGEASLGNFAGRVPCAACDKIKLLLSLFQSASDGTPGRYQLERVGEDGNARLTTRGNWTQRTGRPRDPAATVIALDDNTPAEFSRYVLLDGRLLLMLDAQDELRVGNGAWSYTLSFVDIAELDALTPR
jgi:hypothetical protein